ncbi:MAG TPA: PEP-CTERM sorting domain-containing protein [Tepidisphaeraceae bacterium]|nr:PEP-CTERM sorting domain-containing protein [Tepidisphaeraceae bacterium]
MLRFILRGGVTAAAWVLVGFASTALHASQIAYDGAGDSAYNSGWLPGSNGGYGWGSGWMLSHPSTAQMRSSSADPLSSIGVLRGEGDINSPLAPDGRAWDLGPQPTTAARSFGGPLEIGQTFSLDFESDHRVNDSYDWLELSDGGIDVIDLNAVYGRYDLIPLAGVGATGMVVTDFGIHLAFTRTESGYTVAMTPYDPGATTSVFQVPYTGTVDAFTLGTDGGAPYSGLFANNIAVTPEPGCVGLFALGGAGALLTRRRR